MISKKPSTDANRIPKTEIVSNLPLQMALYFNAFFAPCWIITHVCTLALKFHALHVTYQVILVALHIFTIGVEITRLSLGITGNLMEKIPALSGFWITTLILQLPCVCFLLFNPAIFLLPMERAVDIIQLCFVLFQICVGLAAVRRLANHQVTRFQQQVLDKVE